MDMHDAGWLAVGLILGWLTKIPIFLHYYREAQTLEKQMREYISQMKKERPHD